MAHFASPGVPLDAPEIYSAELSNSNSVIFYNVHPEVVNNGSSSSLLAIALYKLKSLGKFKTPPTIFMINSWLSTGISNDN